MTNSDSTYREPGVSSRVAVSAIVLDPPLVIEPFWMVTDGVVWLTARNTCTFELDEAARFETRARAQSALQHAGKTALTKLHIIRVDLAPTVTDETFVRSLDK